MSTFTFLPATADVLLYQHEILASARIDQAVPGDRGELPGNPVYDHVLEGLHLVARHAALPLLDHLLGWRKQALVKATRAGGEILVLRKRLAVERIFLETAAQLVSAGSSPLSEKQADALEKLAFDWILNAEKYVDSRYAELYKAREKVTALGAVIIGHLADTRLAIIGNRYLKEVEIRLPVDSNVARLEITQLTEGMRHVQLLTDTTPQLIIATDFLSKIHPLKHTAVQRKSSVHHAMCEMLTAILSHLVKEDRPRSQLAKLDGKALAAWYKTVAQMHADLSSWTARHNKHQPVSYPLLTLLTCLEDDSVFKRNIDHLTDQMTRLLRDKNLRTLVLTCLCQCFHSYLGRIGPVARPAEVNAFLGRYTKIVLQNLRKNNLQLSDQHDAVRQICIKISERAPEFGIGSFLVELLQDTANWDVLLIGLRSLITILLNAPARHQATQKFSELEEQADVSPELLDMIRNEHMPLTAYGVAHLTPRISMLLSRVIQNCHSVFAAQLMFRAARTPGELVPQARTAGLNVFTAALRCVPYIMPEHWSGSRLMDDLPGYTLHTDTTVRAIAAEVLRRILRGLPSRRNEVIVGMAVFAAKISDEYPESISQVLVLVDGLMHEWIAILDEKQQGLMKEPNVPGSRRLDLQRLEGIAVAFLCTNDADTRRQALEMLKTVRTLHRTLLASANKERSERIEEEVNYMMHIIENLGSDCARQCYWDFGRWSDLWRVWRPAGDDRIPGEGIDFQDLLRRTATVEDGMRWTRTISEIMRSAGKLCPASARAAYNELCFRISAHMIRDPGGRPLYFPAETSDLWRCELLRNYYMVAMVCPSSTAATKPAPLLTTRELLRLLTSAIKNATEMHQQTAVFAIGYSSSDCYDTLTDELQGLMDDYNSERARTPGSRSRPKGNDIRIQTAQIFRLLASNMPPGTLRSSRIVRTKFLEFVMDAMRFVSNTVSEIWPDVMLVRYCLCFVVRCLASELAASQPALFTPQLRRSLFDALALCCEEGAQGRNRQEMMRAVGAARSRHRSDPEQGRQAEADVAETTEYLEHAAHLALASLLLGPAFDTEAKRHQGRAFGWIERMLTARVPANPPPGISQWGPSKDVVARSALENLLSTNHDVVDVSLDQCYSPHAALSRAYFQVVVEVYAGHDLEIKPHLLLSLVLYKMVDPHSEVRDDALHMLGVLSIRVWKEGLIAPRLDPDPGLPGPSRAQGHVAVVVGNLQDTYQQFQYQVSAKLAREHPELSEGLCVEMMTRQLADSGAHTLQHQVLTALAPWMENLSFRPRWEGNWSEQLLKSMYYVTLQHGGAFPHEIERLWCTVAANKRNVIPILEFLISRGLQEMNAQDIDPLLRFFDVGKRISLYLARISPQQTIDHLAYEITQLIEADDEPMSAPTQPQLTVYEFHHARPVPSRHSSHSSFEGRAFHERQRSHSQPASTGTSGLAGLNLMPQSLLPEIMPDIPQMIASASGNLRRVSDMLRSVSGARADVSESYTSALSEVARRASADFSTASSRRTSVAAPPPPMGRGSMMRAEVAVCLLAEVAYEHDEDFRGHLALLFHSMLLLMDSTDSLVFRHAQQVITHLLYSLSVRHLELHRAAGAMLTEYEKVTSLLTYLQAMRGRRLWHYEDVTLTQINLPSALAVSALTTAILESIFFERDLRERWASEAMKWMLDSNSRHLACRSHQIYRALKPAPSSEACSAMLSCLYKCLSAPSQLALEMAVDIILTLQVIVETMEASKLLLYPQLLLTCFCMLPTTYMHLYALVIDLLQKVLDRLDLNDTTVQHVLLASSPLLPDSAMPQLFGTTKGRLSSTGGGLILGEGEEGWPLGMQLFGREQLFCVQQFMVKGLFKLETELCTIEAMACLADQIANLRQPLNSNLITANNLVFDLQGAQTFHAGLGAILGEVQAQLALSLISQLPWLCRHFRYSVHAGLASISILAHARACRASGYSDLADALLKLCRTGEESLPSILRKLCLEYTNAFFPRFAKVALQRLMEVLQKGDEMYHGVVLDILRAVFEVPGLDLNSGAYYKSETDKGLLAPVASLLEGQYSQQALQVLNAIIEYQDSHPSNIPASEDMLQWPKAIGSNPSADTKMSLEALGRLVENWGYSRKGVKDTLMPFIAGIQFQQDQPRP